MATTAFGMGVDKPDIRFVAYLDAPSSIDAFVQGTGRAGRDGGPAMCLLLYSGEDLEQHRFLARPLTEMDVVATHEAILAHQARDGRAVVSHDTIATEASIDRDQVPLTVHLLDRAGFVERGFNAVGARDVRLTGTPPSDGEVGAVGAAIGAIPADGAGWRFVVFEDLAAQLRLPHARVARAVDTLLDPSYRVLEARDAVIEAIEPSDAGLARLAALQSIAERLAEMLRADARATTGAWVTLTRATIDAAINPSDRGGQHLRYTGMIRCLEWLARLREDGRPPVAVRERLDTVSLRLSASVADIDAALTRLLRLDASVFQRLIEYGAGAAVDMRGLAASCGASTSAIRESLRRLSDLELVRFRPVGGGGFAMTLRLTRPGIATPAELDLDELRAFRQRAEGRLRLVERFALEARGGRSRWEFIRAYLGGAIDPMDLRADPEPILHGLNDEQREAASAPLGYLLINAGAGTGKTETVSRRILHAARIAEIPSDRILALSFSRAARGQLRERMQRVAPDVRVDVRTYHALCLRILWRYAGESPLWVRPGFRIVDTVEVLRRDPFRSLLSAYDDGVDPRERPDHYAKLLQVVTSRRQPNGPDALRPGGRIRLGALGARHAIEVAARDILPLYRRYLDHLREHNLIDFTLVVSETVRLLAARGDVRRRYQALVRTLIVDEYQDTTPAQDELLALLASWYGSLTVVGDSDQTIFDWANADIDNILKFHERYPDPRRVDLVQNYRSTAAILERANRVIARNTRRLSRALRAVTTELGTPPFAVVATGTPVHALVAEALARGFPPGEVAVLCRTNGQATEAAQQLAAAGMPVAGAQRERQLLEGPAGQHLLEALRPVTGAGLSAAAAIRMVAAELQLHEARRRSLEELVRDFEESADDPSVDAFLDYVQTFAQADWSIEGEGAIVTTVHRVKGMEYGAVVVTGLRDGTFPDFRSDEEAERRLFYVAVTRARRWLALHVDGERPSPFVAESGIPYRDGEPAGRSRSPQTRRPRSPAPQGLIGTPNVSQPDGGRQTTNPRDTVEAARRAGRRVRLHYRNRNGKENEHVVTVASIGPKLFNGFCEPCGKDLSFSYSGVLEAELM